MKRKIMAIIAVVSALMMMTVAVSAGGEAVEGRKTCVAYVADITIDGTIEEAWEKAPTLDVNVFKDGRFKGDETKVAGTDYAKATMKILWNGQDYIYLLIQVIDKEIGLGGSNNWDKDTVAYFIQPDNSTDAEAAVATSLLWVHKSQTNDDINYLAVNGGYQMECRIKIEDLTAKSFIGFDVQINDQHWDATERVASLGWGGTEKDLQTPDASVLGQCWLSAVKVENAANESDLPSDDKNTADDSSKPGTSPDTFDPAFLAAAAAVVSGAAVVVVSKKRR